MEIKYTEAFLIIEEQDGCTSLHNAYFEYKDAEEELKRLRDHISYGSMFIEIICIQHKQEK